MLQFTRDPSILSWLRLDQNLDQLVERGIGTFVDLFNLHRADRMLNHQHRVIRRAKSFFFRFGQRIKGVRDQSDRKSSALL